MPGQSDHKVIIQLSDTHITSGGMLHGGVDSLASLTAILASIEQAGPLPDLLLFTGDLADKGEPAAYARFRAAVEPFTARTGVPVLLVPGNHDERDAFREPVWVATATAYQMDVLAAGADVMQGRTGSAFTRIDVKNGTAVATHIPVFDGSPLYTVDFETLRRFLDQGAPDEEIEAAFSPAGER